MFRICSRCVALLVVFVPALGDIAGTSGAALDRCTGMVGVLVCAGPTGDPCHNGAKYVKAPEGERFYLPFQTVHCNLVQANVDANFQCEGQGSDYTVNCLPD